MILSNFPNIFSIGGTRGNNIGDCPYVPRKVGGKLGRAISTRRAIFSSSVDGVAPFHSMWRVPLRNVLKVGVAVILCFLAMGKARCVSIWRNVMFVCVLERDW